MANHASQSNFDVYVRFRPIPSATDQENASTVAALEYTTTSPSAQTESGISAKSCIHLSNNPTSTSSESWKSSPAFSHIFTPSASNQDVFARIVQSRLENVLQGATCNFFAYGHSGSGKTHTIVGYEGTEGLCLAAARGLFLLLSTRNEQQKNEQQDIENDGNALCIALRLYEIRGKNAHDLLNNATQCHVREGPDGRTHIRGPTEELPGGKVRVRPIVAKPCHTFDDLRTAILEGLAHRKTGVSSVHDESSRTHAVLELEIVSRALTEARDELVERESELVPVGKRATDVYLEEQMKSLIRNEDGTYKLDPEKPVDQARIDAAEAEKAECEAKVKGAEDKIRSIFEQGRESGLGGKVVFIDLAGAEYFEKSTSAFSAKAKTKQTLQEQTQGRQINTDLFSLKEVIRARARGEKRIPYRASALTMVLRSAFEGEESGEKKEVKAHSAMILTASSEESMWVATRNTLMYGGLVGEAGR